ncbi:MAG: adenylyltransferase/cytidyltransferase family protein [Gammaproteobacteria bacterium]|nr:adenylyltransferase/cytidyltransferase family protein [Gammaproteobacteria bacterium]
MTKKIVVVSGGFDPLHSGHIAYLQQAKKLGDMLIVSVNSDDWLIRKKAKFFMPQSERTEIIKNLKCVDDIFCNSPQHDLDGSCALVLEQLLEKYPDSEIIFANGGDRTSKNIPEMRIKNNRLKFEFGVGGEDKKNSSSWILKEWKYFTEKRVWGEFSNLFEDDAVKVKELIIEPGQGISYQRHFKRSEMWFISKGVINVKHAMANKHHDDFVVHTLKTDDMIHIKIGDWHQAFNPFDKPCHIIEIQYGEETSEDDIERLEYYGEKNND